MAGKVASYAAKKLMKDEFKKYADKGVGGEYVSSIIHHLMAIASADSISQDPLFEMRPDKRGRMRKFKKQIPDYIPDGDAAILAKVRKRAYRLDMALFNFMGIRFGWSSAIGLVPAIGDGLDMILALSVFRACCSVDGGLPNAMKMQMLFWIIVDFAIGLVPFLGDLLDAAIKANSMNCRLLEKHLDNKYKPKELRNKEKRLSQADPNYRPPAPATIYEGFDDDITEKDQSPVGYRSDSPPVRVAEPKRAHTGRSGRGRQADEEMGYTREELRKARR